MARLEEEGDLDAVGCHRADPDPGGRRIPRTDTRRVPGGSRSSPRSPHGRPTEGPHVPQDALDRMDRRRPIRSLVVPADPPPVLPAGGDGDRRGDRRGGARHVPRDRALRTLHVGLEVGSRSSPSSCSAWASCWCSSTSWATPPISCNSGPPGEGCGLPRLLRHGRPSSSSRPTC